jgi:hypothetical protein
VASWLARRSVSERRLLVLAALLGFAALIQHWYTIADGIQTRFAADVRSYKAMAEAAPHFPASRILQPFAERFPFHWLVGVTSNAGVSVDLAYRGGSLLCLLAVVATVHATVSRLGLTLSEYGLTMAALVASAYPFHYLLASPGMLTDAMLVLGESLLLLGFVRGWLWLVVLGLAVGSLGRQTMVPVGVVAAVWAYVSPAWRPHRLRTAALCALVPGAIYLVLNVVARRFGYPEPGGWHDLSVLGFFDEGWWATTQHFGRVFLGVGVPSALALGGWLRTRNDVPRGALLVGATIAAQPFVLGPSSNGGNEPRLAGLAAPALVVAAGALLWGARLSRAETLVAGLAIVVAGLHSRYTHGPLMWNYVWAGAEVAAALVLVAVIGRRPRETDAVDTRHIETTRMQT